MSLHLNKITARPHFFGNEIELSWVNPDAAQFPGIRIQRRKGRYPLGPDDGHLVIEGEGLSTAIDKNLKSETVYYYALFPYKNTPPEYEIDKKNRISAMATGPYDHAGQMYQLLPGIYHRYDTALPKDPLPEILDADKTRGQLRRFLDLPGAQLDQLLSFAKTIPDFTDVHNIDGNLLPLLAKWIGWRTDNRLEYDAQRNELRDAVSVYQTIGLIPSVEATVKRILGWESRAKEFVHNVARANQPERLNIWAQRERGPGNWAKAIEPFSLGFAYNGRPATIIDSAGTRWFFFHTLRNGRWDLWFKTLAVFDIATSFENNLNDENMSYALQQAFEAAGHVLSLKAHIIKNEDEWLIQDRENHERYTILPGAGQLNVYRWSPSARLTNGSRIDKHPTAVVKGDALWLFWDSFDTINKQHQIHYQVYEAGLWSAPKIFGDPRASQKRPFTILDHSKHLWLFWLEKNGNTWQIKFLRQENNLWNIPAAHTMPTDVGEDPIVQTDLFVFFQPSASASDGDPKIWVFWTRKIPTGQPNQTRWEIAYRIATNIDPDAFTWMHSWSETFPDHLTVDTTILPVVTNFLTWYVNRPPDWSAVFTVSKPTVDDQDREPALFLNAAGEMELYWSSNRNQSWSIWRGILRDTPVPTLDHLEEITENPYSQRDPYPFLVDGIARLTYHSNEPLPYSSTIYGATETVDLRYAGTTSVDTKNLSKIAKRGTYADFQTYSYDTGPEGKPKPETWYARDTIGIYLTPDTDDTSRISQNQRMIDNILREFLPIQIRAVFVIEPTIYKEHVYTTDFPAVVPQRILSDHVFDGTIPELISGVEDAFTERAPEGET